MTQVLYSAAQPLEFDRPLRILALVSLELDAPQRDVILDQLDQNLTVPQVGYDLVELPNTMALRSAIPMGHRLGNYDGYVVFDRPVAPKDWDASLTLFAAQGLCVQLVDGGQGPDLVATDCRAQINAALHLVALTRKWTAQQGSAGFRAPSQRYNLATGGTTV